MIWIFLKYFTHSLEICVIALAYLSSYVFLAGDGWRQQSAEATICHGLEEIKLQNMTEADMRSFIL